MYHDAKHQKEREEPMNSKIRYSLSAVAAALILIATCIPAQASVASEYAQQQYSDAYVLSDVYIDPQGRVLTEANGLVTYSGEIEVGHIETSAPTRKALGAVHRYNFGSSYASTQEIAQLVYKGTAYASGKADFNNYSLHKKRVLQVCFKYTRNGKNLINWQCSNASLGPLYSPGKVVTRTVRDTLNPRAPKTIFRYSYKAY